MHRQKRAVLVEIEMKDPNDLYSAFECALFVQLTMALASRGLSAFDRQRTVCESTGFSGSIIRISLAAVIL